MLGDFHTHTYLSDGVLSPLELIRQAQVRGLGAIALTDHVGPASLERVLRELQQECALARAHWGIQAIPGVELTHLPAAAIPDAARKAKELGAWLVLVHGETLSEPVEPGTNLQALTSPHVDILVHPGLLSEEEARLAAQREIFLELSARKGHCLANGHIALLARATGARLIVSSDAHAEDELLSPALFQAVARGAGLQEEELTALGQNVQLLLSRLPLKVG